MVLHARAARAARLLGRRPAINVVQCLGWSIFELLDHRDRGRRRSPTSVLRLPRAVALDAALRRIALALALLGPIDFVRTFVRKFAVWAVLASLALSDVVGARRRRPRRASGTEPARAGSSVWQGVDLVVAITVSWIPLAADYTRFSRIARAARSGAPASATSCRRSCVRLLGAILVLLASDDRPIRRRCPSQSRRAGSRAILALLALTVDETDEAFANVYSTAVSIQNLAPRAAAARARRRRSRRVATLGALTIDLLSYQTSCSCSASFFVPLFGVLLADWLARRPPLHASRTSSEARRSGLGMIGAWIAGFAALPVAVSDRAAAGGSTSSRSSIRPTGGIGAIAAELRRLASRSGSSSRRSASGASRGLQ